MKKKLLSLLMATCMVAMVLTGCTEKETSADGEKASVEESKEDEKEEAEEAEESTEEAVESEETEESTEEAVESEEVEESTEEVVESEEAEESTEEVVESEEAEESTEEVVESEEEESTEEVVESEEAEETEVDSDIAKMYEGYLEKDDILPEKARLSATTSQMGVSMDMVVAQADDVAMMSYELAEAEMDIYVEKEKVYWRYELQGQEAWSWAPITSDEEAEELNDMSDSTLVDTENISSYAYRETIEEDGVTYDLLEAVVDDGTSTGKATYFVNRETQKVEKCVMVQDDAEVVCLIEEIDTIEIPAEFENATEGTVEDVAMTVLAVIMMGSGMMTE